MEFDETMSCGKVYVGMDAWTSTLLGALPALP